MTVSAQPPSAVSASDLGDVAAAAVSHVGVDLFAVELDTLSADNAVLLATPYLSANPDAIGEALNRIPEDDPPVIGQFPILGWSCSDFGLGLAPTSESAMPLLGCADPTLLLGTSATAAPTAAALNSRPQHVLSTEKPIPALSLYSKLALGLACVMIGIVLTGRYPNLKLAR